MSQERLAGSAHLERLLSLPENGIKPENLSRFFELLHNNGVKIYPAKKESEKMVFTRLRKQLSDSVEMWNAGASIVFRIEMPEGEEDFFLESCPGKERKHDVGIQIFRVGLQNDISKNWLRWIKVGPDGTSDFIFGSNPIGGNGENFFIIHRALV
jgi:hypothetical protein